MKEDQNNIFETADLGTASFLVTKGCKLIQAHRQSGRYSFVFEDKQKCLQLAIAYVNSDYSRFDATLKNLKNLVN